MSRYVLGIDLGTVNSCVAVVQDGKAVVLQDGNDNRIPSCLAIHRGKEVIGHAARRQAVTDPHNTISAVKRILGHPYESKEVQTARERVAYPIRPSPLGDVLLEIAGKELTPIQVSARILARVKEVAENALGCAVDRAVISVPAHFNDVQRKATKQAAEYAGLEVMRLINEPTAAAFAYGYKKGGKFTLAVYDLGGGTFDITVMQARGDTFQVLATDGDSYLGGEDFDHAIQEWLVSEFEAEFEHGLRDDKPALLRIREAAEKAKTELSGSEQARIELPFLAQLPDGTRPTFTRTLDRAKFKELIQPVVQKTLDLCERCLATAKLPRNAIQEVLLVGGQSRTQAVREAVQLFFGREPRRDINPDEVVAMGAALYGYSLAADELAAGAQSDAEDDFAVAVKETALAEKILCDVQRKIDAASTQGGDGLRSRLATLLADLGGPDEETVVRRTPAKLGASPQAKATQAPPKPAKPKPETAKSAPQPAAPKPKPKRAEPPARTEPEESDSELASMPGLEISPSQSGGAGESDGIEDAPFEGLEISPSQGGTASESVEASPGSLDLDGDLDGDLETILSKDKPKPAPKPLSAAEAARSKLQTRIAQRSEAPAAARSKLETRLAAAPQSDDTPAKAQNLPTALGDVKQKLAGIGNIAQEVLDALAEEIAGEKESDELADEAAKLSKALAETVSRAAQATERAETHLKEAHEHANARRVDLIDVTSHALGIGSAGDLMTVLIEHNTSIPFQRERVFTTNQDGQTEVAIRVYQGRAKKASGNQMLGNFVLEGIPPARRMEPKIAVCFRIDENGILSVRARDEASGAQQAMRIEDPLGLQRVEKPQEEA